MAFSYLFIGRVGRRLAKEEAQWAFNDYGERAEQRLLQKMFKTQSTERRRIYRQAIKELRKLYR